MMISCLVPTGPRYTSGGLGKWAGKLSPLDIFNCICPHCPARAAEDPFAVSRKKYLDFCFLSDLSNQLECRTPLSRHGRRPMAAWKLAYHANCWGPLGGDAVGVTSITRLAYRTFGDMAAPHAISRRPAMTASNSSTATFSTARATAYADMRRSSPTPA